MMESGTYRTITGNADKEHQQYVHSLKQANLKVVWIAHSEDDQKIRKNPTIPPAGKRLLMGLTPIPFMSGFIKLTPSLYGTLLLFSVSNLTYLPSYEPIKCTKEV